MLTFHRARLEVIFHRRKSSGFGTICRYYKSGGERSIFADQAISCGKLRVGYWKQVWFLRP